MLTVKVSVSEPVTGLWCQVCLLPSGVAFDVTALSERGVTRPTRFAGCEACGTPISGE